MVEQVYFEATGRRKEAVARVRLRPGKGEIMVNNRPLRDYFCRDTLAVMVRQPLELVGMGDKYDGVARTRGGGLSGQAGAVQLGIARALVKMDESLRKPLREAGLLTRDPRMKERKKYGLAKRRKAFQYSKR